MSICCVYVCICKWFVCLYIRVDFCEFGVGDLLIMNSDVDRLIL